MIVTLLGIGMGGPDTITQEGMRALSEAEVVLAAPRLLESLPLGVTSERVKSVSSTEIADYLKAHKELKTACVAFSGDIGFYSGARGLQELISKEGYEIRQLCGISTVQYMAARLGMPWQGINLVSAHGRDCDVLSEVLNHESCFFLTGGELTPRVICQRLFEAGLVDCDVTVAVKLGYEDEKIVKGKTSDFLNSSFPSLAAMLVKRLVPTFCYEPRSHGIRDEEFIRGKTPMTKREVRGVVLSYLELKEDDIAYDIGAGTGSVSVEMALTLRRGRVYAVEKTEEGCELITQNRERFGVYNLLCSHGSAPEACTVLPPPTVAFVGGSDGNLPAVLAMLKEKNPVVRVVITAVTIETLTTAEASLRGLGFGEIDTVLVSISRFEALGSYHHLKAQNPVFVISARP